MRLVIAFCLAAACGTAFASTPAPRATLKPFASEREFDDLIARWRDAARAVQERRRQEGAATGALSMAAPTAAPAAKAAADSSAGAAAESITNVQTAGVDEGGIVKRAGEHLVILRRGRLFTLRVGGDQLKPIAMLDAYAPGADPRGAWYDELLVHDERTVVVIGYSYARGGTEIGLFDLGTDGSLAYRATHHLRSHDYYSSRNYASRLIGSRLVFYTPMAINPWSLQVDQFLPQWRRWHASAPGDWQRILPATRIFRTDDEIDPLTGGAALHTVTSCDLARPADMRCESSAVLGPPGRVFYVSAGSVYVWAAEAQRRSSWGRPGADGMIRSAVFRLPLDSSAAPSALKTTGSPIDQLSFLEDEGGHLNILLRAGARGDGMWHAERGAGELALLRVPLASFGDGRDSAPRSAYRPLPALPGHTLHNRFVGDWLLVGTPAGGATGEPALALRYAARDEAQRIALRHGVERIEGLGRDAVLVGNAGRDLRFTSLRLSGTSAEVAGTHVQSDAAQGETRTHGFFYRARGHDDGLIGLPVVGAGRSGSNAYRRDSAGVLFLRNRALALQPVGELRAHGGTPQADQCRASCVDWYGNARPIFMGERVFALLGYELVEGRLASSGWRDERIDELRRVNFAPQPSMAWGRD